MIYVLRTKNASPSFIKIGYTARDIGKRIGSIQTGCPFELELAMFFAGTNRHEKMIHGRLRSFRTNGEWFMDSQEVFEEIEKVKKEFNLGTASNATVRMTDDQKRTNRHIKSATGVAWTIGHYCEHFRVNKREILSLDVQKRKFGVSRMAWIDSSQKYELYSPEYDGLEIIIHSFINRGEEAILSIKSLTESRCAEKDIQHYRNSLEIFKEWQRRNRDFRTII